jgi:hypothetical protein
MFLPHFSDPNTTEQALADMRQGQSPGFWGSRLCHPGWAQHGPREIGTHLLSCPSCWAHLTRAQLTTHPSSNLASPARCCPVCLEHASMLLPQDLCTCQPCTWSTSPVKHMDPTFTSSRALLKCRLLVEIPLYLFICVLISCCCCNKLPQTWCLEATHMNYLTILEVRSPRWSHWAKRKVWAQLGPPEARGRTCIPGLAALPSTSKATVTSASLGCGLSPDTSFLLHYEDSTDGHWPTWEMMTVSQLKVSSLATEIHL